MSTSRIVLASILLVLSVGACRRDRCVSVCEQRKKELGCKSPERCKATCDELHAQSPCSAQMRGWEACLVSTPANQWECDGRGQPVPRETACQAARANVVTCISKFPEWPPPPPKN